MGKYIENFYTFENLNQAKSLIKSLNISDNDPIYREIIAKTNKDGYTGLITRLIFKDGIDKTQAFNLYDSIKSKKVDLGRINNLTYQQILDLINPAKSNDYEKVLEYQDYDIYEVNEYKGILKIGSPGWCLKTKSNWITYTETKGGVQFVAVKKGYLNKLLVPNTWKGDQFTYENKINPKDRYGITMYSNGKSDIFNDNNDRVYATDIKLSKLIYDYCITNNKFENKKKTLVDSYALFISDDKEINCEQLSQEKYELQETIGVFSIDDDLLYIENKEDYIAYDWDEDNWYNLGYYTREGFYCGDYSSGYKIGKKSVYIKKISDCNKIELGALVKDWQHEFSYYEDSLLQNINVNEIEIPGCYEIKYTEYNADYNDKDETIFYYQGHTYATLKDVKVLV